MDRYENAEQAYENGDFTLARSLYEQLAESGNVYSLVPLARLYIDGRGGGVDLERAESLLDRALKLGVKEALLQKAALHVARNDMPAYYQSIRNAADSGLLPATYLLAKCHMAGIGVELDLHKGFEIMKVAANRGHLGARMSVGRILMRNPLQIADFLAGFWLFMVSVFVSAYLVIRDPTSDRLR